MKTTPNPRDVIELEPTRSPDGRVTWTVPASRGEAPGAPLVDQVMSTDPGRSLAVLRDGRIVTEKNETLSTLPTERLASETHDWNRIIESIRAAEAGHGDGDELVVQPGGAVVPVRRGTTGPALSKVPEERLAAGLARVADLEEARRLDPGNAEKWAFVEDPLAPGLRFEMAPVAQRFVFFCFRVPAFRGDWFLSVLSPDLDRLIGHEHHIVHLNFGGEKIPVVCKSNAGSNHANLAEVRGTASKFAIYHSLRSHGPVPFSA